MTNVTRFNFGFPINVTEEILFSEVNDFKKKNFSNKNLHLKITIEDKLGRNFNSEVFKQEIKEATHCENIKIDYFYDNESSERSKEIAEAVTVIDKFKKFAELNEIKYNDSVLTKIENIQNNLLISNAVPNDAFELEYVSLRGAVGIWEGQQKDDIEFDFTKYNDGIIGLFGENGKGKTFSIEMMNPYNSHLTRMGSLKDYFRLKDSHKILIYKNSVGKRYKISMLIDGKATSVMTIYKIEIMEPGSTVWTDGPEIKSADDYKKWAESVFGPKDLFLRTAFFTTKVIKSTPDLSVATKTEKMTLFFALAGIEYLSKFNEQSKLIIKNEEKEIETIKSKLPNFDNIDSRLTEIGDTIVRNSQELENYKKLVDIDTQELELCNEEQKKYLAAAGAYDIVRKTLTEKEIKVEDSERAMAKIEVSIQSIMEDMEDMDLYKQQLEWYDTNVPKLKELSHKRDELETARMFAREEYEKALSLNRSIEKEIDNLANINYKLALENTSLSKSLPKVDDVCPLCGAPLSAHKKDELELELKSISEKIKINEDAIKSNEGKIMDQQQLISDLSELDSKVKLLDKAVLEVANDISDINSYSANIDIAKVRDIINNSETKLKDFEESRNNIIKEQEQLKLDITDLHDKLTNIPVDYSDKIARLTRGIQDSQQHIATLTAENSSLERERVNLSKNEELVKTIKAEIKEHQNTIKDYMIIQNAFSNSGIQALELDSAAPEISEIANAILHESYGERFTIKFDTQRETKNEKKTIDDFIIRVFDSRSGSWKVLEDLSQGESLWIKQSLYYAFSVIRARRTGFCFKTRFLDESDGPLDTPATRLLYLKMIEMAHKMSNASKTILITHSQEIKEMLEQKIEL